MTKPYQVHPLVRSFGKARIEVTRQAKDEQEWQKLWRAPKHSLPFKWSTIWKECVEYKVEDFASEVGFFIDLLGFSVHLFSPSYARLTTPGEDFFFAISACREGELPTPAEALRLQFGIEDLAETIVELENRGLTVEQVVQEAASEWDVASLRTPNGIWIDLVAPAEIGHEVEPELATEASTLGAEGLSDQDGEADDLGDVDEATEEEIPAQAEIDPVELVTSQEYKAQDENALLPFLLKTSQRQERLTARRSRSRAIPRLNEFNLSDISRLPARRPVPDKGINKPRSNGELTYVEIEDEDETES